MPSPFYYYTETYGGSEISINVQRDSSAFDSSSGPVMLSNVIGMIDGVEVINDSYPFDSVDGRPRLLDRLAQILQDLKNEIDSLDEFDLAMTAISFTGGSEPIENYTVTPVSGGFSHSWTNDPDIDIETLDQADDADFLVNLTTGIHSGSLTPPIADTVYGSGVNKFFRIRGQRIGYAPGPWSYGSGTSL